MYDYDDVRFGTLVSFDMSGHNKESPPMPRETSALGIVLETDTDGVHKLFKVCFVHPYPVIGLIEWVPEGAIQWGQAAGASDEEVASMLHSPHLNQRENPAIVRLIKFFLKEYAIPTPKKGDWVVYNYTVWKANPSGLGEELALHSIHSNYEVDLPAPGAEIPSAATQRVITALVAERNRLQWKLEEMAVELRRRRLGEPQTM